MSISISDAEYIRSIIRDEIQKHEAEKKRLEEIRNQDICRCGPGGMPLDGCSRHRWEPVLRDDCRIGDHTNNPLDGGKDHE